MAIAFDTLEYARRLKQAGFSDAQAEGQTQALVAAMSEGLATRQDVAAVGQEVAQLRQEMGSLEARLTSSWRQDLAVAETCLTLRLGGITAAGIAVVSALVKLL